MAEAVTERRLKPIEDYIKNGQWKQALKDCEKWHKKGETSDKFLALKAYVLSKQQEPATKDRGRNELLQLARRATLPTDQYSIDTLIEGLEELSLDQDATKLWQRAVSNAGNEDLALAKLQKNLDKNDWVQAQQTVNTLKTTFPKERKYDFWNVFLSYWLSTSSDVDEKQREFHAKLAYARIKKALQSVSGSQSFAPETGITTPEELHLLVHIFCHTNHASEALEVQLGPTCGPKSKIWQQDPQEAISLLVKTFGHLESWDKAFIVTKDLLEDPVSASDNQLWDFLVQTQLRSGFQRQTELEALLANSKAHRVTRMIRMTCISAQTMNSKDKAAALLQLCKDHYLEHQGRRYCFQDLEKHLDALDETAQTEFVKFQAEHANTNPSQWTKWARLYLERKLTPGLEQPTTLLKRATAGLKHYSDALLLDSKSINPDGLMIAALDLIQLSKLTGNVEFLLRAALLLEIAAPKLADNFAISVLLIECYLNLGVISRAMELFTKLSIKNLQWQTVGHLLLTRIGSIYPQRIDDLENSPLVALQDGMEVFRRSASYCTNGMIVALQNGSYSNIIDAASVKHFAERNISFWAFGLERRRIVRLHGLPNEQGMSMDIERPLDDRDYSFLAIGIPQDKSLHDWLRPGPICSQQWLNCMVLPEAVVSILKNDLAGNVARSEESMQLCHQRLKSLQNESVHATSHLTATELALTKIYLNLLSIICETRDCIRCKAENSAAAIRSVEKWIIGMTDIRNKEDDNWESSASTKSSMLIKGLRIPRWNFLHESYSILEFCQIAKLLLTWIQSRKKPKKTSKAAVQPEAEVQIDGSQILDNLGPSLGDWIAHRGRDLLEKSGESAEPTQNGTVDDLHQSDNPNIAAIFTKEKIATWTSLLTKLEEAVKQSAKSMNRSLNTGQKGVDDAVTKIASVAFASGGDGDEENIKEENKKWEELMRQLYEEWRLESKVLHEACRKVKEGWEDAVEGILKINV